MLVRSHAPTHRWADEMPRICAMLEFMVKKELSYDVSILFAYYRKMVDTMAKASGRPASVLTAAGP